MKKMLLICGLLVTSLGGWTSTSLYGQDNPDELYDRGVELLNANKYPEAESVLRRYLAAIGDVRDLRYVAGAIVLAPTLEALARYAEAEAYRRTAIDIYKVVVDSTSRNFSVLLDYLALNLGYQGRYYEAEPLIRRAVQIRKVVLGERSPDYAIYLISLTTNLEDQGRYAEAEQFHRQALEILRVEPGVRDAGYADVLNYLAANLDAQGRYVETETIIRQSLEIWKAVLGERHPRYAKSLGSLASNLERWQGRHTEAEAIYRQVLEILNTALGDRHPDYASSLHSLASNLDRRQGRHVEAEPLYRQALEIQKDLLSERHPHYALYLSSLALCLSSQGTYAEAEYLQRKALAIVEVVPGKHHPDYAGALNRLAHFLGGQGKDAEAEPLHRKALEIEKAVLGELHPDYAWSLSNLGNNLEDQGKHAEAAPLHNQALEIRWWHYNANQEGLSEAQRQQLYETGLGPSYRQLLTRSALRPAHTNPAYAWNWHLNLRGLQLQTSARLRSLVASSIDSTLLTTFANWRNQREYLSALYSLTPDKLTQRRVDLRTEEAKAIELEGTLNKRSAAFRQARDTTQITWQQLATKLGPGEGVVDIARYTFYTKTGYLVFLYCTGWDAPKTVVLPDANWLETAGLARHRRSITRAQADPEVFRRFWSPIDSALGSIERLYLAVDGVFNQINVNTLQYPNGDYVIDRTDVVQVGSFRDLVLPVSRPEPPLAATVLGRPAYQLDTTVFVSNYLVSNTLRGGITDVVGAEWADLPGTEKEAQDIAGIFRSNGYATSLLLGADATESALKSLRQPRVLHVATHGFFVPKPKDATATSPAAKRGLQGLSREEVSAYNFERDPLLRSGIVLAGVSNASKDKRELKEDGVLTAYEAGTLNLQGTELVVLSACETGLGEVQSGEGIYGLQRSIQLAGAEAVLTSLWRVNDSTTEQLMTEFYPIWLGGKSKRKAFREAQLSIRKKYPEPQFWGAFVMLGE